MRQFALLMRLGCTVAMDRDLLARITVEPGKCGGRPCIRGKRLRVTDVLELLADGASFDEILGDYPFLAGRHPRCHCLRGPADRSRRARHRMKWLIDNQLPLKLATHLSGRGGRGRPAA